MEEWGWLGKPASKKSLYVRRITLFRKNDEDVILVTSLTDADKYPATDLMDAYLLRWGIENVFQQVTEVFHLQRLISSTPPRNNLSVLVLSAVVQSDPGYPRLHCPGSAENSRIQSPVKWSSTMFIAN